MSNMESKVDTGTIINYKYFPVMSTDTVYSLTIRTYSYLLTLFYEIMTMFWNLAEVIPHVEAKWTRKPYTHQELEELCYITQDMSQEEIERRIRATTYPNQPGAYIEFAGRKWRVET